MTTSEKIAKIDRIYKSVENLTGLRLQVGAAVQWTNKRDGFVEGIVSKIYALQNGMVFYFIVNEITGEHVGQLYLHEKA